ncbi:30S ribosomal protein S27ae [Archaeoglobales archaeon]|nr:MAG: 30S ribosomal protein S27ae [Archaeoglobales archaeon ex4484_92]RLI83249.1 MAG: 30S ribosomal protein S27ae [Archaeoglobales archaeon]HDN74457.1 30S ribosomal protein S27ae [Archaeoglobus sp.]
MAKGSDSIYKYYEIKGEKVIRKRRTCPRCGEGVFLAEHPDRRTCGKCGYTEFKRR